MCSVYHQYCFSDWIHHLVMESDNEIQRFFPLLLLCGTCLAVYLAAKS